MLGIYGLCGLIKLGSAGCLSLGRRSIMNCGFRAALLLLVFTSSLNASIVGVSSGLSSAGARAVILTSTPAHLLDDNLTNRGMQGFDEGQGVKTTLAYTVVNSHMIYLNSDGRMTVTHENVTWTFDGEILGVMSDSAGFLEAFSTPELGNPATNYTQTSSGSGAAAPYNNRGFEGNDRYTISDNQLTVTMKVKEPGDWIRVLTEFPSVPETGSLSIWSLTLCVGLVAMGLQRARTRMCA